MIAADLPNRRVEAWKYSDLRAAVGGALPPLALAPTDAPPASARFKALKPIELVIENGRVAHWPGGYVRKASRVLSKSEPDAPLYDGGSVMGRMAADLAADDWMAIVEAGDDGRPVWLRVIGDATPTSGHARVGLVVPEGRTLNLIETYEGPSTGFTNILIEAFVAAGGVLRRTVHQCTGGDAVVVSTAQVNLEGDAALSQIIVAEGAKLARLETHVNVEGEGASVELNGVYMTGAGRHADLTSVITHQVANGTTRQLIKGVARKGGRGVFQGKIVVERGAQKTDARQYHHGLLLEDGAEIFAKPELMIHADDVECAHGNTAGGLDESALFYLRSRGVLEAQARAMLIEAFLSEAVPADLPEALREDLLARIGAWLGGKSP